mgnify:FL=1
MSWLSRLKAARGGQTLGAQAEETLQAWQALPEPVLDRSHFETRYTVVNTEATGLDLDQARLLAVGGIAVDAGLLHPGDAYYVRLEPAPADALVGLLGLAGKNPLVVFNASFNRSMLERAFQHHVGFTPSFVWIDLYLLLPSLFPEKLDRPARLADWMAAFGIETFQRHHALGDAWAIAQLFLAVQARALSFAVSTPAGLADHQSAYRQKLKI